MSIVPANDRDRTVLKAPVPGKNEAPKIPPCTKNFVKQNALDNINSRKILICNSFSCLVPKKIGNEQPSPLVKKDYGKVPEYLQHRIVSMKKAELEYANSMAQQQHEQETEQLKQQGIVVLPDEERHRILKGLQENWEKLNQDYQRLSLTVDTVPKIAR